MKNHLKFSMLLMTASLIGTRLDATEEIFILSSESFDKIHSDEFVSLKKTFAESPSLFHANSDFNIPQSIAFDDSSGKIHLTPGDVIKISEDLTFSDWVGSSSSTQVAEEDFTLPNDKIKKTEQEGEAKTKNIKFSRTPS